MSVSRSNSSLGIMKRIGGWCNYDINFKKGSVHRYTYRIRPIPSKVKIAEPIVRVKEDGLKGTTLGAIPREDSPLISYCQMYIRPIIINISASSAAGPSFEIFLISAKGIRIRN